MHSRRSDAKRDASPERGRGKRDKSRSKYGTDPELADKRCADHPHRTRKKKREQEMAEGEYTARNPPKVPYKDADGKVIWNERNPQKRPAWKPGRVDAIYGACPSSSVNVPGVGNVTFYQCQNPSCGVFHTRTKAVAKKLLKVAPAALPVIGGKPVGTVHCEVQHLQPWKLWITRKAKPRKEMEVDGVLLRYFTAEDVTKYCSSRENLDIWCFTCNNKDKDSGAGTAHKLAPKWAEL